MARKPAIAMTELARQLVTPRALTEEQARRWNAAVDSMPDLTEEQRQRLRKQAGDAVWEL